MKYVILFIFFCARDGAHNLMVGRDKHLTKDLHSESFW